MNTYLRSARALPVFLGKCDACVRPVRLDTGSTDGPDFRTISCPDCLAGVLGERLYGTVSGMTCDIRCEGAYGPICECACGGANHSGRWSQSGTMLADALAKYRAEVTARQAKQEAKREAETRRVRSAFEVWADENRVVVDGLLAEDFTAGQYPNGFLDDLADQLRGFRTLSERQVNAASSILAKRKAAQDRDAARKAARSTLAGALAATVPTGRHEVTGTVRGIKEVQDDYSYSGGTITKITVDTGSWRVFGTCPRSILWHASKDGTHGVRDLIQRGDKITFMAQLEPSKDDPSFGFFKNPRQAKFTE